MMRFSTIADRFLRCLGYEPRRCGSDEEAKRFAATMPEDTRKLPVVYFRSDTTGEKDFEEFFVEGESVDMARFAALGVICESCRRSADEVREFIGEPGGNFRQPRIHKRGYCKGTKRFSP